MAKQKVGDRQYNEEYVAINGISQYFLHYPTPDGEVMLILHGGPAQSEAHLAYYAEPNPPEYTSVYYDQRGAGKTLIKNSTDGSDVTLEQLLNDLAATVQYVKKKYGKDKIILSGHSWGSLLGLIYTYNNPQDILYYTGAGQVVNFLQGEKLFFDKLKDAAKANTQDTHKLLQLGDYPYNLKTYADFAKVSKTVLKLKRRYGMVMDSKRIKQIFMKSPVFKFTDLLAMLKAPKLIGRLIEALTDFDAGKMTDFAVPIYFIHGENDTQVPIELVKNISAS
ncbi:MAG: alpha/beta hydrolase [Clostridiales bacterium]|jgi:pimeloyl-ACP methyl ester carboxylesterase|nr:alpha/beta hydrolase [Clostridiales bacterium]